MGDNGNNRSATNMVPPGKPKAKDSIGTASNAFTEKRRPGLLSSFIFPFYFLPLFCLAIIAIFILDRGTPGFRIENGPDCFVISRVDTKANPVREGDRIIAIGGLKYPQVLGYLFLKDSLDHPGKYVTIVRNGRKVKLTLRYVPLGISEFVKAAGMHIAIISILLFLAILAVTRAAPGQPARLFATTLTFFSLIVACEFPLHFGILDPSIQSLTFALLVTANWLAFSSWTHFVCQFPVERRLLNGKPLAVAAIYLLPPLVSIGATLLLAGPVPEFFGLLQRLRYWSVPLIITGTWLKHLNDYRKVSSPLVKNQLKLLLVAGIAGISPYGLFYLLPNLLLGYPLIAFRLVLLFGLLIPLAFCVAIMRYRLLDVNSFISGGITYIILVLGLMLSYTWLVVILERFLWRQNKISEEILLVYFLAIAVLFNPIKNRLRSVIDRAFFRDQIDYRKLLYDFSRKVASTIKMHDLATLIVERLPDQLRLKRTCLMILEEKRNRLYPRHPRLARHLRAQSAVVEAFKSKKDYLLCQDECHDPRLASELEEIHRAGFLLVFGLKSGSKIMGLLFVGPKKNESFFTRAQIQVLATMANQVAGALENALMYESLEKSRDELRQMFNRVVKTEKLATIGEMAAALAHEIKNPLGVIRSSAQQLMSKSGRPENGRELLSFIIEEVDNLNHTVNNMLGLARYKPPRFKALNIGRHLSEVLETWKRHAAHNKKIDITFERRQINQDIYADGKQLEQVFFNLLQNSEDVMPQGGVITIEAMKDDARDGVVIKFYDTGPGLPDEYAGKVFEKFFTTKEKGLGLGLSICRQIINAHNGTIDIHDNNGRGTVARIWLPRFPHAALKPVWH